MTNADVPNRSWVRVCSPSPCISALYPAACAIAGLLPQSCPYFVVDRGRGLLCCLDGDHECVSHRLTSTKVLGVVHAFNVDRERVIVAEHHGAAALGDLVLEAPSPDRVVLRINAFSACELLVWSGEVHLRTSVTVEPTDSGGHVRQGDGEAMPFCACTKRRREWQLVGVTLVAGYQPSAD